MKIHTPYPSFVFTNKTMKSLRYLPGRGGRRDLLGLVIFQCSNRDIIGRQCGDGFNRRQWISHRWSWIVQYFPVFVFILVIIFLSLNITAIAILIFDISWGGGHFPFFWWPLTFLAYEFTLLFFFWSYNSLLLDLMCHQFLGLQKSLR